MPGQVAGWVARGLSQSGAGAGHSSALHSYQAPLPAGLLQEAVGL
jgi:hypothetical protein